jgi:hypothetical protein
MTEDLESQAPSVRGNRSDGLATSPSQVYMTEDSEN